MSTLPELRITPLAGKADLDRFIDLPNHALGSDPVWVPPLKLERRMHLSAKTNPWFEHGRWQAWLAWRGDEPVGRISAQVDPLHLQRHQDGAGFFGLLDAEDSQETFAALLATAEGWLRQQGMARARGPFSLSINDEVGLLVDGFDTPPVFMMGHARPDYATHVAACGYRGVKDLLAYTIAPDFTAPRVMDALIRRSGKNIRVRPLARQHFDADIALIRDLFNDAWSHNWGFVPFTDAEFKDLAQTLRHLVPPELIQFAEVDGKPEAFIVALPNINEAIRGLHGRLLPLGWAKLLWRLKVRFPHSARVPLMGVRKALQNTRLGPGLAFLVIDAVRKHLTERGVRAVEMSWILEDNSGMCNIIETIGGRAYKRYRVYERELT